MADELVALECDLWKTVQFELTSSIEYADPYRDVTVDVQFVGPEDQVIVRPAFWDGGTRWGVRFAPTASGRWSFRVDVGGADDPELGSAAGEVIGHAPAGAGNAVEKSGFLRQSATGTYLEHQDGTPFFWLGDTHWRFAWERWDEANKPGWKSQFRDTVDLRVAQGFTVYQSNISAWGPSPFWAQGEPLTIPSPEYFRDVLDPRMAYIANSGLVNALGLAWYQAVDYDPANVAQFARAVVARYGSYPMVWTLGGEIAGYEANRRRGRLDSWRSVAQTIAHADAYHHPLTAHLTNQRPIVDDFQDEPWQTLTLNQLGHGDRDLDPRHYAAYRTAHPRTPIVEGESLYEGLTTMESTGRRTVTDTMVRQVAYRAMQSGCCGYTYGAQGCWNGAWEHGDSATEWGDLPWYEGVELPGAIQLGHMRRIYESLAWWRLESAADAFVTDSWANTDFYPPAVAATPERSHLIVYFGETFRQEGQAALVGLTDTEYAVRWIDPRTGASTDLGATRAVGGRVEIPQKPDANDWVLIAESTPQHASTAQRAPGKDRGPVTCRPSDPSEGRNDGFEGNVRAPRT